MLKTPWLDNYGDIPHTLDYFDGTMFEAVKAASYKYSDCTAYEFMGRKTTYKRFVEKVELCARSLKSIGINEDDRVTICMPNCPQALIMFYAINLVGAVSNMIHPLSAEKEIEFYLNESKSTAALTLDQFYYKFESVCSNVNLKHLIIASIKDELPIFLIPGYILTEGRKIKKTPKGAQILYWKKFLSLGNNFNCEYRSYRGNDDPAVILYSGGTTGTTKGILLSNRNFNALSAQVVATNPIYSPRDKMLSVMPLFHGFGLGISIHTVLSNGATCVLVPRFTPKSYAKLIVKTKCNFIAGVPTLFEAILHQKVMTRADLSCLKGVFCGGDSLPVELKKRFDLFLKEHNSEIHIREGYGTTECVTASCLTPLHLEKEGSIGQPFPDTYYKIVKVGTIDELPYGEEGEICISGPTVMLGYLDRPEETALALKVHEDGLTWLHTGDIGVMDDDGFIYFRQRIKRIIITSGYNVYPSQIENILDSHELVNLSCVIGIPDKYKMQRIKAFVMLKDGVPPTEENMQILMDYCRKHIAKYALPYEIEFRADMPKTLIGKVAYRELEKEELDRIKEAGDKYEKTQ